MTIEFEQLLANRWFHWSCGYRFETALHDKLMEPVELQFPNEAASSRAGILNPAFHPVHRAQKQPGTRTFALVNLLRRARRNEITFYPKEGETLAQHTERIVLDIVK